MSRRPRALARGWLFDLDGTLTVSTHDYAALKRSLGLPPDLAVLEGVARAPAADQPQLRAALDAWEIGHASAAVAQPGARTLLSALVEAGVPVGIVTRNTRATALRTLAAVDLDGFVSAAAVIGREEAAPKPSPEGLHAAAAALGIGAADTAMVGDFRFDLAAARAAGALAVWLDVDGSGAFTDLADLVVRSLDELLD